MLAMIGSAVDRRVELLAAYRKVRREFVCVPADRHRLRVDPAFARSKSEANRTTGMYAYARYNTIGMTIRIAPPRSGVSMPLSALAVASVCCVP